MPLKKSAFKHSPNDQGTAPADTVIETTATVLGDGTILEMILDSEFKDEARLLAWNGEEAAISKRFEHDGKIYVPPKLNPVVLRALRLPTNIAPYGSTRGLFQEILAALIHYSRLAEIYARQIVYTIFASWMIERLWVAPLVSIIAPVGSPRTQFLSLLLTLYRRPLLLAEANLGVLSRVPTDLRPTCLLDEPESSLRVQRLLYTCHNRGAVIARNGHVIDVFSAKVVCTREPIRDGLLASQALRINLTPASPEAPFLGIAEAMQLAEEFQPKLLCYRLQNLAHVRTPEIDVAELSAPMQEVARALASSFPDHEDLQRGAVDVLRERDDEIRIQRSTEPESTILEALRVSMHEEDRQHVLCGEIADIVNELWEKRGESQRIKPESVGWKLAALELHTQPIGSAGKGLRFTNAVRARAHALAREYRIPTLEQTAKEGCPYCDASGAASDGLAAAPPAT